jgi:hypothetical protein
MTEKKRAATMSAAEQQLDGCPLPASLVARTLSIRRCVALFCSSVSNSGEAVELAIGTPFGIGCQGYCLTLLVFSIGSNRTGLEASKMKRGESINLNNIGSMGSQMSISSRSLMEVVS